jgi:cellulose synthase/poly-beta-1,6-N-acetylglucosamine synthase-like glycosyltransferase
VEGLLWALKTSSAFKLVWMFGRPLLILMAVYYSSVLFVAARILLRKLGVIVDPITTRTGALPDAVLLLPTLVSKRSEVVGLQQAIESALTNGYPGKLSICVAVDEATRMPALVKELETWLSRLELPPGADVSLVRVPKRVGKAMAMEHAVAFIQKQVERGERAAFPPLFFNLDADSKLSPRALERMAFKLVTPKGLFKEPPMIVTSNVRVRRSHYWQGWRNFFTVRGQLAILAAREFTNAISLGRHSERMLPVTSVSGALYCTWSEIHLQAPRFSRFVQTLRLRDWVKWWFGAPPPSFTAANVEPLPEACTGPGDDTWISWIAMGARWTNGRIDLELPATPWIALKELIRSYLSRPIAFDPLAMVSTSSPTTIRALFRQRVRWNTSRLWLFHRRGYSFFFSWNVSAPVFADLYLLFMVHAAFIIGFALFPFMRQPASWFALLIMFQLFYLSVRAAVTFVAMIQNGSLREQWPLMLAVPLSGVFHTVFNILTTIWGFFCDLFLFGVNTGFAPEETLMKVGKGRPALAYRVRRALRLAVRALRHGDVPFGWFWFGWEETRWTTNGYRGWTTPQTPAPKPTKPRHRPKRLRDPATAQLGATNDTPANLAAIVTTTE